MTDEINRSHDKIWYVRREGGKVFGPMSAVKIRQYVAEGRVELSDHVSRDRRNWVTVRAEAEVTPLQMRHPEAFADEGQARGRGRVWVTFVVLALVVAGLITAALLFDSSDPTVAIDCNAAPAPGINWNNCNKHRVDAERGQLDNLLASNTVMTGASFAAASLTNANLNYARLDDADLAYANLTSASLKGASLKNADLSNAVLRDADLRFADFSGARLSGADLSGAKLDSAVWMDGRECQRGSLGACR